MKKYNKAGMFLFCVVIVVLWSRLSLAQQIPGTSGTTTAPPVARNYYIDAVNGNDANDGTLANPYQNLTKINSLPLHDIDEKKLEEKMLKYHIGFFSKRT